MIVSMAGHGATGPPNGEGGSSEEGRSSTPSDEVLLSTAMDRARPADDDEEAFALDNVKARLFGRAHRPLMLSRYLLLDRMGAGGLGVVYAAYDPDLDRKVAIKLLRAGGAGDQDPTRSRLVREAQAMAKLSHPNVIAVHDVGTIDREADEDEPAPGIRRRGVFVVMEYIDGVDLLVWSRQADRTWREIVSAYVAAGRGLEAAHRAGLVHRDFKPSNVLVDREGRVRVLDFGLARAVDALDEAERPASGPPPSTPPVLDTPLTRTGGVLGTPAYMAPEQHDGQVADSRSDQYAFCVALYEALYGDRPFAGATVEQLAIAKRDSTVVVPPATSAVPRRIFDAIARGLSVDPQDRFGSMSALLAAIEDRPPARRWLTAGIVGTALGIGVAAVVWPTDDAAADPCGGFAAALHGVWDSATRQRLQAQFEHSGQSYARASYASVASELDAYTRDWLQRREAACRDTMVRRTQSVEVMNRRIACLDRGLERVAELVRMLTEADGALVEQAVTAVEDLPPLSACDRPQWIDAADPTDAEQLSRLERALLRAATLRAAGRLDEALAEAEAAVAIARTPEHPTGLGRSLIVLGRVHLGRGDADAAREAGYEALAQAEREGDARTAAHALILLAETDVDAVDLTQAERSLAIAAAKIEQHALGRGIELDLQQVDALLQRRAGNFGESLDVSRDLLARALRARGPDHTEVARSHMQVANSLQHLGKLEDAEHHLEQARRIYADKLGDTHPAVGTVLDNLGNLAQAAGDFETALAHHRRALEILEQSYGPLHPRVAAASSNLANDLGSLGRDDEAAEHLERARRALETAKGPDHPDVAIVLSNLVNIHLDRDRPQQALAAADRALQIFEASLPPDHPNLAHGHGARGLALHHLRRYQEAAAALNRARTIWQQTLGPDHPNVGLIHKALGENALADKNHTEAAGHLERAIAILGHDGADPKERTLARFELAAALAPTDVTRSRAILTEAQTEWRELGQSPTDLEAKLPDYARVP